MVYLCIDVLTTMRNLQAPLLSIRSFFVNKVTTTSTNFWWHFVETNWQQFATHHKNQLWLSLIKISGVIELLSWKDQTYMEAHIQQGEHILYWTILLWKGHSINHYWCANLYVMSRECHSWMQIEELGKKHTRGENKWSHCAQSWICIKLYLWLRDILRNVKSVGTFFVHFSGYVWSI